MSRWQKHLPPFAHEHFLPAPATQPSLITSPAQLWILITSCQSGGCLHGNQIKAPSQPYSRLPDIKPTVQHSLVPTAQVALAFLSSSSFSLQLPTSLILELHDSGVGLRPCPWSWSLRVSMDGKALS